VATPWIWGGWKGSGQGIRLRGTLSNKPAPCGVTKELFGCKENTGMRKRLLTVGRRPDREPSLLSGNKYKRRYVITESRIRTKKEKGKVAERQGPRYLTGKGFVDERQDRCLIWPVREAEANTRRFERESSSWSSSAKMGQNIGAEGP